ILSFFVSEFGNFNRNTWFLVDLNLISLPNFLPLSMLRFEFQEEEEVDGTQSYACFLFFDLRVSFFLLLSFVILCICCYVVGLLNAPEAYGSSPTLAVTSPT